MSLPAPLLYQAGASDCAVIRTSVLSCSLSRVFTLIAVQSQVSQSWGWVEGAQPWKGSHLLNEASTSQVQHLNSLQDAIFLSRIHMCFAVISQHLGKGVQVQTFGIALYWVSVEL